ncbi:MAG: hypothetical protein QOK31_973 [Solirubrobacteraceae bacterium]|jgi:hypothetical protein|nr:hypothetical protein [Solirubrobacteraceae bacterium]
MIYLAVLICSDEECTERFEAQGTLADLESLACDCGCAMHVLRWPEPVEHLHLVDPVDAVAQPELAAAA